MLSAIFVFGSSTLAFAKTADVQALNPAVSATTSISTPENYEGWLTKELKTVDSSKINEVSNGLTTFKKLSKAQKDSFISILNNPKLLANVLTTDVKVGESKSFSDGSIIVSSIQITKPQLAPLNTSAIPSLSSSASVIRVATYKRTVYLYGIAIFQTTNLVQYAYSGTTITEIQNYDAYTSINLNPTVSTTWSGITAWGIGSDTVYTSGNVHYGFLYSGLGMVYGNGCAGLWVNVGNNTSSGFYYDI